MSFQKNFELRNLYFIKVTIIQLRVRRESIWNRVIFLVFHPIKVNIFFISSTSEMGIKRHLLPFTSQNFYHIQARQWYCRSFALDPSWFNQLIVPDFVQMFQFKPESVLFTLYLTLWPIRLVKGMTKAIELLETFCSCNWCGFHS